MILIKGLPKKYKTKFSKACGLLISVPNQEFFDHAKTVPAKIHVEIEINIDGLSYYMTRKELLKLLNGV